MTVYHPPMVSKDTERRHNRKLVQTRLDRDALAMLRNRAERSGLTVYKLASRILTQWVYDEEQREMEGG